MHASCCRCTARILIHQQIKAPDASPRAHWRWTSPAPRTNSRGFRSPRGGSHSGGRGRRRSRSCPRSPARTHKSTAAGRRGSRPHTPGGGFASEFRAEQEKRSEGRLGCEGRAGKKVCWAWSRAGALSGEAHISPAEARAVVRVAVEPGAHRRAVREHVRRADPVVARLRSGWPRRAVGVVELAAGAPAAADVRAGLTERL